MASDRARPASRAALPGAAVAGLTALVSGVAVFVNSYGVRSVPDAALYTTAKNATAAVVLLAASLLVPALRRRPGGAGAWGETAEAPAAGRLAAVVALAYVGGVGGGVAFVAFFAGLARSSAEPAAFLHDTLVLWVALLAWPLCGERPRARNVAAIGLLLAGQVALLGGVGPLLAGGGQLLVLLATLLWAVEVVVDKRLLARLAPGTVALVRMGGGSLALVAYLGATGRLALLGSLGAGALAWVAVTGVLLAAYVATWLVALARARALDVTSVLVASVLVTAALGDAAGRATLAPQALGLALVAAGTAAAVSAWPRRRPA